MQNTVYHFVNNSILPIPSETNAPKLYLWNTFLKILFFPLEYPCDHTTIVEACTTSLHGFYIGLLYFSNLIKCFLIVHNRKLGLVEANFSVFWGVQVKIRSCWPLFQLTNLLKGIKVIQFMKVYACNEIGCSEKSATRQILIFDCHWIIQLYSYITQVSILVHSLGKQSLNTWRFWSA